MLFVVFSIDKSQGAAEIRNVTRPAHLEFMQSLGEKVKAGGPLFTHNGQQALGGMYVLEVENYQQAQTIAHQDPYFKANLFSQQYIQPWKWNSHRPVDVNPW